MQVLAHTPCYQQAVSLFSSLCLTSTLCANWCCSFRQFATTNLRFLRCTLRHSLLPALKAHRNQGCRLQSQRKRGLAACDKPWRRGWDLNPRSGLPGQRLSRAPHSASLAPLQNYLREDNSTYHKQGMLFRFQDSFTHSLRETNPITFLAYSSPFRKYWWHGVV